MEQQIIERLIKRLIVKKDYTLLRDQMGDIDLRNDINVLLKQENEYVNYVQLIDGDICSLEEIQQRLNEADQVLMNLRERESTIYAYTIVVFDREIGGEKEAYVKGWQDIHLTEHDSFKCFTIDARNKKVEKLFSRATRDDGLRKVLDQVIKIDKEEMWEKKSIEEMAREQLEGYAITYKVKKPFLTYILIGVNIFMFFFLLFCENQTGRSYQELLITYGAKVNKNIIEGELGRLFTAMFLHASVQHLVVNCYSLLVLGSLVERLYGRAQFISSYLISGVIGNIVSFMFVRGTSVGASGAIFGLMGVLLYYGIEHPKQFKKYFSRGVFITIAINLIFGLAVSNIDNCAHFGGLVGGFLAIGMLSKAEKVKWYTNRILYLALLIAVTVGGLYYGFNNERSQSIRRVSRLEELEKMEKWEELEQEGEELLAMETKEVSDQINILWKVAKAEIMLGKYGEALHHGDLLSDISPENGYYLCGIIYLSIGQDDLAKDSFTMAYLSGNTQAKELLDSVSRTE